MINKLKCLFRWHELCEEFNFSPIWWRELHRKDSCRNCNKSFLVTEKGKEEWTSYLEKEYKWFYPKYREVQLRKQGKWEEYLEKEQQMNRELKELQQKQERWFLENPTKDINDWYLEKQWKQ